MKSVPVLLGAVLALAASAVAEARPVVRFPPKGGIPYTVQVPDRPGEARRNTIQNEYGRFERRKTSPRVVRPLR